MLVDVVVGGRGASRCGGCGRFTWVRCVFRQPRRLFCAAWLLVLTPLLPLLRKVLKINTTCSPPPWRQRYMHKPSSCTLGALRLSFRSRSCRSYVHPRRWQGPFILLSSSVHPRVPYGSPGLLCLRGGAVFVLASAGKLPWLGARDARLAVFGAVPCSAAPLVCVSVSQGGCQWSGWFGLVARRPLAWCVGFLGPPRSSPPQVFSDRCPRVRLSRRPRALVLVSHSSLHPLPLDIICSQVVCPDVGTPCALQWAPPDLVPWCMIFPEVIRPGGTFVPGPPPWEAAPPAS